jgi:hypothetical protein
MSSGNLGDEDGTDVEEFDSIEQPFDTYQSHIRCSRVVRRLCRRKLSPNDYFLY